MAEILYGKPVADVIYSDLKHRVEKLSTLSITPSVSIIRVGNSEADISYEKGILKRAGSLGIKTDVTVYNDCVSHDELVAKINSLNSDRLVHGIMIFRPLPKTLHSYERSIIDSISPIKDVDGATLVSMAGVFMKESVGFCPCTPEACITLLDHYGIEVEGKRITVIGRSPVVGKPLSILLTDRNATVTLCHTKTRNIQDIAKEADVLITAAGKPGLVTVNFVKKDQTIIDVSVNLDPVSGKMTGDLSPGLDAFVHALTPVPGGIGAVTSMILMSHIVRAAENQVN